MAKDIELQEQPYIEDCPPCPTVAPLYLGTFADMAILLMAFFVILLALAVFSPEKLQTMDSVAASISGVQREIEVFQEATAESLVMEQFRSARVEPTVYDIIEEERSDQRPREADPDTSIARSTQTTNALEVVQQRLASQIAEGKVETRIEEDRVVVELLDADASRSETDLYTLEPGQLDREIIEIFLQVATAQSETRGLIEVIDGTELIEASETRDIDTVARTYRDVILALSDEISSGQVTVTREDEEIIIRIPGDQSFPSGSAQLQPNFRSLLENIGDMLLPIPAITRVEGHTDNVPLSFGGRYGDNWDLSSARAASVAEFFLDELYLRPGDIYIMAFADSVPVATNETAEGRASNRRIDIVVSPF